MRLAWHRTPRRNQTWQFVRVQRRFIQQSAIQQGGVIFNTPSAHCGTQNILPPYNTPPSHFSRVSPTTSQPMADTCSVRGSMRMIPLAEIGIAVVQ